jgi:hypothetical protein
MRPKNYKKARHGAFYQQSYWQWKRIDNESDIEEDDLTQAELDELTASFSDWSSSILTTSEQQLKWAHSQDVQILQIDRNT